MMAWQSQLRDGLCDLPWWLSCARYGMVRGCGLLDCMRGTIHRRQQPDGAHKRRFFWHFAAPWQAIFSLLPCPVAQDKSLPLVTSVSGRVDDYALTGMQANWHIRF